MLNDIIALIANTQNKLWQASGCLSPSPPSRVALSVLSLVSLSYQMRAGWSFTILTPAILPAFIPTSCSLKVKLPFTKDGPYLLTS